VIVASLDVNEVGVLRKLARDIDSMLAAPALPVAAADADAEAGVGPSDGAPEPEPEPEPDPLHAIVGLPSGPGPSRPTDPVLARLLPDAYGEDEAAGEFRRFTEAELRETKRGAIDTMLTSLPPSGGKVRLDEEQAEAWLAALNDIRLALGVHLDVAEEWYLELRQLDPMSPRARRLMIYELLTRWQSSLLVAVTGYDD